MIQTTATGSGGIVSTGANAVYSGFSVGFSIGGVNNIIQVYSYSADYRPTTGKRINDGLWHTVLVTYDGTTLSIYVDGRLDNTATNWNSASTSPIASQLNTVGNTENRLGQLNSIDLCFWVGKLKNVQLYDYVIINSYALAYSYQLAGSSIYTSGIN